MKQGLKKIENDVFDICDRLKTIDQGYFAVYNKLKSRYEVHNTNQGSDTFCFVVPFDSLDSRTIDLCLSSRRQNADKLFADIEKHNEQNEIRLAKEAQQKAQGKIEIIKEFL